MNLTTTTYDSFKELVEAHMGRRLESYEVPMMNALANQGARNAYQDCDYWPRFLVIGEPRTVTRGFVETSEDSFHVYGAGTDDVNGLYVTSSAVNGKVSYKKEGTDADGDTVAKYDIRWDGSTDWEIQARQYITSGGRIVTINDAWLYEPGDVMYSITNSSTTPPTGAWTTSDNGDDPTPSLVDVADIDTILRVHKGEPYITRGRPEYFAPVESRGSRVIHGSTNDLPSIVYVTYKKAMTDTYGDGTNSTVTTIPSEWSDYMSLYVARALQVANRQSNANELYATITLTELNRALEDERAKIEAMHIFDTVGKRVITHKATSTLI